MQNIISSEHLQVTLDQHILTIECMGTWSIMDSHETFDLRQLYREKIESIIFRATQLQRVTSPLLIFLKNLQHFAEQQHISLVMENVHQNIQ
jgi:hypothetical protein